MRKRNVHVQFWLDKKEAEAFNKKVKRSGLSREAYLRHLVNGLVPQDAPPPAYYDFMRELHRIGGNLNQIAQKAHVLGVIDERRYDEEMRKFDQLVRDITKAVDPAQANGVTMATTSIWRVNGWLGKVLIYIENPDKTENPDFFEKQDMDGKEAQGLSDVIEMPSSSKKQARRWKARRNGPAAVCFRGELQPLYCPRRDDGGKKRFGKDGRDCCLPRLSILCPRRGYAGAGP